VSDTTQHELRVLALAEAGLDPHTDAGSALEARITLIAKMQRLGLLTDQCAITKLGLERLHPTPAPRVCNVCGAEEDAWWACDRDGCGRLTNFTPL
jgi:hypothetical protein